MKAPFLSIIIACWREPAERLARTLKSIEATAGGQPLEVIVVAEGAESLILFGYPSVSFPIKKLWNPQRLGHAYCRDRAASEAAAGDWLLFTDAHMIFEPGWFEAFLEQALQAYSEQVLFCGPYVFSREEWEPDKRPPDLFYGARFFYWERNGPELDVLNYKPITSTAAAAVPYEVPAVIGANYFLRWAWFKQIGGLKGLYGWSGMDEFLLSVKTWLCGGSVRIIPNLRLRHVLHKSGLGDNGYGKEMSKAELLYNKLAGARTILSPSEYTAFIDAWPRGQNENAFQLALTWAEDRREELIQARELFSRNACRDHDWLCSKFRLNHPMDIGGAQYGLGCSPAQLAVPA